jgi:hypothetical protein
MAVTRKGGPLLASVFLVLPGGIASAQDIELQTADNAEQAVEVIEEIVVVGSRKSSSSARAFEGATSARRARSPR